MKQSYTIFLEAMLSEYVDPSKGRRMHRDNPAVDAENVKVGDYIIPSLTANKAQDEEAEKEDKEAEKEDKEAKKKAKKEKEKAAKEAEDKEKDAREKYFDAIKATAAGGGRTYAAIATSPVISAMRKLSSGASGRRTGPVI